MQRRLHKMYSTPHDDLTSCGLEQGGCEGETPILPHRPIPDHPFQHQRLMRELIPQSADQRDLPDQRREVYACLDRVERSAARAAEEYAAFAATCFRKVGR